MTIITKNIILIGVIWLIQLFSVDYNHLFSQTYSPSTNNTYTTCGGTFYDSGGTGSNYTDDQSYTVTFCSGTGQNICIEFFTYYISFPFCYFTNRWFYYNNFFINRRKNK